MCTIVLQSTLQAYQREGWALFWVVLHLTMKEHVYSDLMTSKQIIGQCTTELPVALNLSPDGTQHSQWHHIRGQGKYDSPYTPPYYGSYNIYYSARMDYVSTLDCGTISRKTYTCCQGHINAEAIKYASLLPIITQLQSVWVGLWTLKTILCAASILQTSLIPRLNFSLAPCGLFEK